MKTFKYLLTAAAGIALSGCALSNVNDVNTMRTTNAQGGTAFTQALTDEYRSLTVNEADQEYEWDDAAYYARKGMRASQGEVVLPSEMAIAPDGANGRYGAREPAFQIPPARAPELGNARARLIAFLDGGGRAGQPIVAAHAQGSYDCWLEEEWEIQGDTVCRDEFLRTEKQFRVTQTQTTSATTTTMKVNAVQVFFDFDRSNISESAARTLQQAAVNAKQGKVVHIDLTGHTDSSGSDEYNQALSERRAAAVKAELIKNGVPANEITSIGVGKAGQLLPTADGVREPQNRRTEIIIK